MNKKNLGIATLFLSIISVAYVFYPEKKQPVTHAESTQKNYMNIYLIIQSEYSLDQAAKIIWEEQIGGAILMDIKAFKQDHPIPFAAYKKGETWASLKETLDVAMQDPMAGASYSWEEFRDIDKDFYQKTVNAALTQLGLKPVVWGTTGTVGYNSDIDNVATGPAPFINIMAKILADTLHQYMYDLNSDALFDEEIYSDHPGATLRTINYLQFPSSFEKYKKIAFSLAQLQMQHNTVNSKILPWNTYRDNFIEFFPDVHSVLLSVDEYEEDFTKASEEDRKTIQAIYDKKGMPAPTDLAELISLKAIAALSRQLRDFDAKVQVLQDSLKREAALLEKQNISKDMENVFEAALKEKDDLLIQMALLFALQGTYFPESYYTQEAFQVVVQGDELNSQVMTGLIQKYINQGNLQKFQTVEELRKYILQQNLGLFTTATPFSHMISLGEQLGYLIHKLEGAPDDQSISMAVGGKYLKRFSFSFNRLMQYLNEKNTNSQLDLDVLNPFNERLIQVADVLALYQRGKVHLSKADIYDTVFQFVSEALPQEPWFSRSSMAQNVSEYITREASDALLSAQQRQQNLLHIFSNLGPVLDVQVFEKLEKALDAKVSGVEIITKDPKMTLVLNASMGLPRQNSPVILAHYDQSLNQSLKELGLHTREASITLLNEIVRSYMQAVKLYFSLPENNFSPYSLNYNEVSLNHVYDPRELIPD